MGSSIRAIELASKVKEKYDEKCIIINVRHTLGEALKYGVLCMRGFADVDRKARLEGVKALLRAEYMVLQVVAFPKDDIVREPDTEELLHKAMKLGLMLLEVYPGSKIIVKMNENILKLLSK